MIASPLAFGAKPRYCIVKKNSPIFSTFWGVRVARPQTSKESFDMPMTSKKRKGGAKRKTTRKAASARGPARKTTRKTGAKRKSTKRKARKAAAS